MASGQVDLAAPTPIVASRAACRDATERGFFSAAAACPVVERSFEIAGRAIVLRFAGDALIDAIVSPLAHHPPAADGSPRLVVNLWDAASTGVAVPPFPDSARDGGITGAERVSDPGDLRLAFLHSQRALCLLERESGTAYYCTTDARTLPYWERGAPLLALLHWWMDDHGRQLVHGAALGRHDGGVLLVAPGGSGKSSTALAALAPSGDDHGLRYAGDDYCLVGLDPSPWAYSLYGTGKVNADQAERFPDLVAGPLLNADRVGEEKALFLVSRRSPAKMVRRFPISALVVPVIDGGRCRVEPLSPGRALQALAPSTVLQLPGAGAKALSTLAALTRRVPTYALRLSPDPRDAPPVLAALVDRLAAGVRS